MSTYTTYDAIINVELDEQAIEYARGMVWGECETTEQTISHGRFIALVNGIGVYYNYGADYYFFTEEYDDDEDDDYREHDGQPDEAQEWHDFDPDC